MKNALTELEEFLDHISFYRRTPVDDEHRKHQTNGRQSLAKRTAEKRKEEYAPKGHFVHIHSLQGSNIKCKQRQRKTTNQLVRQLSTQSQGGYQWWITVQNEEGLEHQLCLLNRQKER